MTKEELKIKVLMETGKELGIDLEKEGADLKKPGRLIIERFDNMKMYNPKLYDKTIASLNKELGLNLLGLSVIDFAKAAADDKSDIAHALERKLDEIFDMKNKNNTNLVDELQKHLGKLQEENAKEEKTGDDGQDQQQAAVVTDKETGTYKPAKRGATMK
ncbi:hypothetical protein [uncultured Bartonella sp.]|uniref:hypothetical protein n=1 Tax=uncultured Bartonella sp. TaxID=104108 RepID=UPI002632A7FE|nr:hypothetical protein [uncultured Bartonella sp.]